MITCTGSMDGASTDATAATRSSRVVGRVICSVLPPCRVTTTWSVPGRPAPLAASTSEPTMDTRVLTTTVEADPHWWVWALLNLPSVTEANWTPPEWIRSIPAYSGTEVRLETPGTTSKSMPPRTQAAASSATALSRNGSPVTRRTTREPAVDRKSTRLNSSHANISYAVFCL